ncbi:MAG: hypothetical protein ACOY44_04235 [Pseudomonadota bacterium]
MSADNATDPHRRIAQLRAELRQLEAAEKRRMMRANETRRRILIGAAIMHKINAGEWPRDRLLTMLESYLTRDRDRALFDLLPMSKTATKPATKPATAKPAPQVPAAASSGAALERPAWADGSDLMHGETEADYILRKHIEGPPQGWK